MSIFCYKTVSMVNHDQISIAAGIFGAGNPAMRLNLDFVSCTACQVNPFMRGALAPERIASCAVLGSYPITPYRLAQRHIF